MSLPPNNEDWDSSSTFSETTSDSDFEENDFFLDVVHERSHLARMEILSQENEILQW